MIRQLTDAELFARLEALAAQERGDAADIVEHLAELERRDIVADTGCATLFDYCVRVLRYSEAAAFLRIRAARAALVSPRVIEDLRSGAVHLDAVMRLAPHLTEENGERLLDLASGASKREVQRLVAELGGGMPAPERDVVRMLPMTPTAAPRALETAPPADAVIPPPARVRLAFTASDEFLVMVERLRSLRRHKFPEGRLEDLLQKAVVAWLAKLDPCRDGAGASPKTRARKRNRWIPRDVKRQVWRRDGGRCAFVSPDGRRCECRDFLEYDHRVPYALGGRSDLPANIRLLCRPHNQRLARKRFGPRPRDAAADLVRPDAPGQQSAEGHDLV